MLCKQQLLPVSLQPNTTSDVCTNGGYTITYNTTHLSGWPITAAVSPLVTVFFSPKGGYHHEVAKVVASAGGLSQRVLRSPYGLQPTAQVSCTVPFLYWGGPALVIQQLSAPLK